MENFSGPETGQKFRNDPDESKWAKLISTIKENSISDLNLDQLVQFGEFLNGKNAVFGNQIVKNESDFYFDVLTELFNAYRRAGYINRMASNWMQPENHEKATKVLIMILHGLRALCKSGVDRSGKFPYLPLYLGIFDIANRITNKITAAKLDKAFDGLWGEFASKLENFKHYAELSKQIAEQFSKHKCYTAYKNLITIFICCLPKHNREVHQCIIENSFHVEKPDWNFTSYLLLKTWNVVRSRIKNEEADEDDLKESKYLITCLMKFPRIQNEKTFECLKHICAKLCSIAKEDEFVKQLIYDKIISDIKIYSTAPNVLVSYRAEQIALVLQPILPPSLKSASYSEELFRQLALIPPALKMDDPVIRVLAINAFKRWCEWDWCRLVEEQPEKTVQCVKRISKLVLSKNGQTAAAALDFFQRIILEIEESRPMLSKLLQGCNQYDKRIIEAIDITAVRNSPHENVRKAFFILLRICNRTNSIKWNHVCSVRKVINHLAEEKDDEIKNIMIRLLTYNLFKVSSYDDKEGVMKCLKNLIAMSNDHDVSVTISFIESLSKWLQEYGEEYLSGSSLLFGSILRKFGHQICNWADSETSDPSQCPENIRMSLTLSEVIWRSHRGGFTIPDTEQLKQSPHKENISALISEIREIWMKIIVGLFNSEDTSLELKKITLGISTMFRADDIDRISVPIKGSFKAGHQNPDLPIGALILWKQPGHLWSIITDWIANYIQGLDRDSGVRFVEERDQLDIAYIVAYLKGLIKYDGAFDSAACEDVGVYLKKLESIYLENIVDQKTPKMNEISDAELKVFTEAKVKILRSRPMGDRLELINSKSYFNMIQSFESQSEERMKSAVFMTRRYIANMKTLLMESVENIIDEDYENNWVEIIETNPKLFYGMIIDVLNFFYALLKYRLGKSESVEIEPFINLLKTFLIQVVVKAQKYQGQEIPKKQISQIIDSLQQNKVKIAMFDVLQVTLDPGLDFENHSDSAIFMINFLTDECKNDESIDNVANIFETWINGRVNQNTEQLEKEEFTAGWIMKRFETTLSEDSRRRSFDRIKQTKLYELGQDQIATGRVNQSLGLDDSNFDNDEPLSQVSRLSYQSALHTSIH